MKILHLATDDKFLDHAFPVFEKVYPGANNVFVFASVEPLKHVKLRPDHIETRQNGYFFKKPKLSEVLYEQYDLIVFHSLGEALYPELDNMPQETPKIWLGWGFDYYPELLSHTSLYLNGTQEILSNIKNHISLKRKIIVLAKKAIRLLFPLSGKVRAVEKITVFSPVLPKEYEMVRDSRSWKCFPEFASWNYGTLEDNLIFGFEGESVTGNAILVGNSATYTGNHVEAFSLLHQLKLKERRVIAPLSYGDAKLAEKLTAMGKEYFEDNFEPLADFMPIEDYVAVIKQCGYVIMNHVRQQAVGNIVIMLYLGARVFLRHENPVYDFLKREGVTLSTIQGLEANPQLINQPLTESERSRNRAIVSEYWGRGRAYERTRQLVEKAFQVKGVVCPVACS